MSTDPRPCRVHCGSTYSWSTHPSSRTSNATGRSSRSISHRSRSGTTTDANHSRVPHRCARGRGSLESRRSAIAARDPQSSSLLRVVLAAARRRSNDSDARTLPALRSFCLEQRCTDSRQAGAPLERMRMCRSALAVEFPRPLTAPRTGRRLQRRRRATRTVAPRSQRSDG
jgi:hypothetical protein